ncbi:hypothetical protein DASC09_027090 [Saccharomycopsis crataegensis]|uniref:Uncharacterized protein n=1 Tax=Saccharomycopsis crataegensis TaxID=43959 RepID=A0AAV5QLR6_9ASCO|nr:hypothetical protein DASC09_027090 [Saccharomycopsis crataegensis]
MCPQDKPKSRHQSIPLVVNIPEESVESINIPSVHSPCQNISDGIHGQREPCGNLLFIFIVWDVIHTRKKGSK